MLFVSKNPQVPNCIKSVYFNNLSSSTSRKVIIMFGSSAVSLGINQFFINFFFLNFRFIAFMLTYYKKTNKSVYLDNSANGLVFLKNFNVISYWHSCTSFNETVKVNNPLFFFKKSLLGVTVDRAAFMDCCMPYGIVKDLGNKNLYNNITLVNRDSVCIK